MAGATAARGFSGRFTTGCSPRDGADGVRHHLRSPGKERAAAHRARAAKGLSI
jgi:hypothetical protein